MDYQAKYQDQEESGFFADGAAMQAPPVGTVAREDRVELDGFATGKSGGALVAALPAAAVEAFGDDAALAARGAERYDIYCAVCHGASGDGRGPLYHRSGVESGDLRQARLREVPDGHIFDVMTNGLGLMSAYAAQIPVEDRWAIVAHVRQLQADADAGNGGEGGTVAPEPSPATVEPANTVASSGAGGDTAADPATLGDTTGEGR